jgi:hypothetical protein
MNFATTPLLIEENDIEENNIEERFEIGPMFMWGGLLFLGFLISRLTCWCGLPADCIMVGMGDLEYLFVYCCVAGLIINIVDNERNYILRRWWFWLIYIISGIIFSAIGEIKVMQWSLTQDVIWSPYIVVTIIGSSSIVLGLFYKLVMCYRVIKYWILLILIYTIRTIQVLSSPFIHLHHYWLVWNIIILCPISNNIFIDILLAVFLGIFVQGVAEYGAAPIN